MLRTFKEGSLVCVATRLRAECSGVRIPVGAGDLLFSIPVKIGPRAHPTFYSLGPGVKAAVAWPSPLTII